ncbi:lactose regulatory protein lac9 and GAL4-like protein [Aspergillus wentii]|nr:lactose regulatory protein lac9 and GAL4-like protein [Aspergillus wentii]
MLETALGKLFPNGEMEAITRSLLEDDMEPQSGVSGSSEDMLQDIIGDDAQLPSLDELLPADGGMNQLSIPTGSVEDEKVLLDSYFQHYHTLNPFIHEATFKAEYAKQIPITHPNAWPILTNAILAIGAWTLHQSNTDKKYYSIAKQHLQQIPMFEQGNITMVQALLLLTDYAHKQGSPDESWQYMGTAMRMTISLNLHSEEANSGFSALDQEIRRRWLEKRQLNITEHEYENERHCRVQGLDIARTTIDLITSLIMNGEYSRLTLSFTLYALFHALLVPVIHLKASPSSPTSISCIQDIDKVKHILPYLPIKEDALSLYFLVMLNRLCSIASRAGDEKGPLKPGELRMSSNNIFGNEELAVLEREMRGKDEVDFSEWVEE